ncbi:CBR-PQN-73 protein, partial [Aphelenchoides avenae]
DCFDFCIPEYGIEHDYIRDESYLNIVRRDCFYLFVPEWRNFAGYTNQQNQQDFENYYRGATGGASMGGGVAAIGNTLGNVAGQIGSTLGNVAENVRNNPTVQQLGQQVESKWIALQQVPQQIANFSQATLSNLRTNLNNWDPRQQQQQFPGQQHQQFSMQNPNMQRNDPNVAMAGQQPPPQFGNFPNDPRLSGFRGPSDAFQVQQQRPMGVGSPVPQNFQGQAVQQQQLPANDGWNGLSVLHQTPQTADGGMRQNPGMVASGFSPNNPNMPPQAPMNVQQQFPPQQTVGADLSFQNQRQDGQPHPAWVSG